MNKGKIYRITGFDKIVPLSSFSLKNKPKAKFFWFQLDFSEAKDYLSKTKIIPDKLVNTLCNDNIRPRVQIQQDALLANFKQSRMKKEKGLFPHVPLCLYISEEIVITITRDSKTKISLFDQLQASYAKGDGPVSTGEFAAHIYQYLVDQDEDFYEEINHMIVQVENDVEAFFGQDKPHSKNFNLARIHQIRANILYLEKHLLLNRDEVNLLTQHEFPWINKEIKIRLQQIEHCYSFLIKDIDTSRHQVAVLHDQVIAVLQSKTNNIIYILSIISVVFLPITFVTGLLGINVGGIPGADKPLGFTLVCLILVLFVALQIYILKKILKWF